MSTAFWRLLTGPRRSRPRPSVRLRPLPLRLGQFSRVAAGRRTTPAVSSSRPLRRRRSSPRRRRRRHGLSPPAARRPLLLAGASQGSTRISLLSARLFLILITIDDGWLLPWLVCLGMFQQILQFQSAIDENNHVRAGHRRETCSVCKSQAPAAGSAGPRLPYGYRSVRRVGSGMGATPGRQHAARAGMAAASGSKRQPQTRSRVSARYLESRNRIDSSRRSNPSPRYWPRNGPARARGGPGWGARASRPRGSAAPPLPVQTARRLFSIPAAGAARSQRAASTLRVCGVRWDGEPRRSAGRYRVRPSNLLRPTFRPTAILIRKE